MTEIGDDSSEWVPVDRKKGKKGKQPKKPKGAFWLFTEGGFYRKHRVYVMLNEMQVDDGLSMILNDVDLVVFSGSKTTKWNDGSTHFLASNKNPNPIGTRSPFMINISSVPYMGWDKEKGITFENIKSDDILNYFRKHVRKQLGTHLFVHRNGLICSLFVQLNRDNTPGVFGTYNINSVYPNIGNDLYDDKETQSILMGLLYSYVERDAPEYQKTGLRHYHRFGWDVLKIGGVFDVTDEDFYEMVNMTVPLKDNCFVLYVCSGAKLMILDECTDSKHHSRTLVQAGGVVLAEYELRFEFLHEWKKIVGVSDGITSGVFNGQAFTQSSQKKFVLFLGANESQHDSICWKLCITPDLNNPKKMKFHLILHEGAFIEAVEDWDTGLEEIWARYRYHRLMERTVEFENTEHLDTRELDISFTVPGDEMYRKIVGLTNRIPPLTEHFYGIYRSLGCFEDRVDLPREYYFQSFKPFRNRVYFPLIPPLYPPIYDDIGDGRKYYWPPTPHFPHVEKHYFILRVSHREFPNRKKKVVVLKYNDKVYALVDQISNEEKFEYNWIKCEWNVNMSQADGVNTRVGVDGWVYEKSNLKIGKTLTASYIPLDEHPFDRDTWNIDYRDWLYSYTTRGF